mmetsp:Transcript_86299/g.272279  ORF Transcript_86299/g.272279 Transcript_86299/m.272279 type:complete len:222 (-) Transcript_86299:68-733(-)
MLRRRRIGGGTSASSVGSIDLCLRSGTSFTSASISVTDSIISSLLRNASCCSCRRCFSFPRKTKAITAIMLSPATYFAWPVLLTTLFAASNVSMLCCTVSAGPAGAVCTRSGSSPVLRFSELVLHDGATGTPPAPGASIVAYALRGWTTAAVCMKSGSSLAVRFSNNVLADITTVIPPARRACPSEGGILSALDAQGKTTRRTRVAATARRWKGPVVMEDI